MLDIERLHHLGDVKWSMVLTVWVTKVKKNNPPSKASFGYLLTV